MSDKSPINHGTYGGYQVHLRRNEEPCDPCKEASRTYRQNWRTTMNPKAEKRLHTDQQLRNRALRILGRRHAKELRTIIGQLKADTFRE